MGQEPDRYRTIAHAVEAELEVRRSRFHARLVPVTDEAAAREVVAETRKRFWDAGHHCSAFVLGSAADLERSSDDGEPSGTAGAPMLDALRSTGLTDVLAVVSRWFGGVLLGTGGLVRAYGDAVRLVTTEASIRDVRRLRLLRATLDPGTAGRFEAELRARGVAVLGVTWGEQVEILIGVPPGEAGAVEALTAELTGGRAHLTEAGERWS